MLRTLAAAVIAALALGGCSSQQSSTSSSGASLPSTDPALDAFTHQSVTWKPCEKTLECATFTVPVDYAKPSGETTTIQAIRIKSTNPEAKPLFVNPGGPGGSGYDLVAEGGERFSAKAIADNYTVVGFDPRGVGKSDPIRCLSDEERDKRRAANIDPSTPEGLAAAHAEAKATGEACVKNSGPVLAHMDTASVAKDLDVMRAALGSEKLHYLGYSYGTQIGSTYAALFPKNVGRMVLDGAVAPGLTDEQLNLGQARGFEKSVSAYVASCLTGPKCPLTGSIKEGKAQLSALLAEYRKKPGKTSDGRTVTADDLMQAIVLPMYNPKYWSLLTIALTDLIKRENPDSMMVLADSAADRDEHGKYTSNGDFAFTAVTCLDGPLSTTDAQMKAQAAKLTAEAPFMGPLMGYSQVSCVEWPVKPSSPAPAVTPESSVEALVVGTKYDPATPYDWAKQLTSALGEKAVLLTYDAFGHTAYGRGNECVNKAVETYLAQGTMPAADTVCS